MLEASALRLAMPWMRPSPPKMRPRMARILHPVSRLQPQQHCDTRHILLSVLVSLMMAAGVFYAAMHSLLFWNIFKKDITFPLTLLEKMPQYIKVTTLSRSGKNRKEIK